MVGAVKCFVMLCDPDMEQPPKRQATVLGAARFPIPIRLHVSEIKIKMNNETNKLVRVSMSMAEHFVFTDERPASYISLAHRTPHTSHFTFVNALEL